MTDDPPNPGDAGQPDPFEVRASARVVELLGDDADLDTFAAAFTLFRLFTRVLHDLETTAHREHGLSTAGFRVLFTVWVMDESEPREIARLSGVSRAAVSGVLNTLERDGLVDKRKDQPDRRLITVRLTDRGERTLRTAYEAQQEREAAIFAEIDRPQLVEFTRTMRRLLRTPSDGEITTS